MPETDVHDIEDAVGIPRQTVIEPWQPTLPGLEEYGYEIEQADDK
nr:MAG TPA: hypothetical protein [Caudoviricetes sp.]